MKIEITSLLISNPSLRVAKRINFESGINLITSNINSVGKSVIMKSIYHALGADCAFDPNLQSENMLFDVSFSFNSFSFRIARYKECFAVVKDGCLVKYVKYGGRSQLSSFYKDEIGTSVFLKSRQNSTEIAPPAYLFIPYYLDQDKSWKEEQYPFSTKSMGQYDPLSRMDLYSYHLGIYKEDYGRLKSDVEALANQIKQARDDLDVLDDSYNGVKESLGNQSTIENEEELESVYRYNSRIMDGLLSEQNSFLAALHDLDSKKTKCIIQIREIESIIKKLEKDDQPITKVVSCPNCGEEFDVDLKDEMVDIYNKVLLNKELETLRNEVQSIDSQIEITKANILRTTNEVNEKNKKLNESKNDYEHFVSRKALSSLFDELLKRVGQKSAELSSLTSQQTDVQKKLNDIRENTSKAKSDFCDKYINFLNKLDINCFSPSQIAAFKKMPLSGSQYVRSTLAFFFAFLQTKEDFNKGAFNWPLVIDSPREGEQDKEHSADILNFIFEQRLPDYQCIVASVNAKDFLDSTHLQSAYVIELPDSKDQVMNSNDYDANVDFIDSEMAYFKRVN